MRQKNKQSLVKCPIFGLDTKTYWLTDCQSQCDFDFDFDFDYERNVKLTTAARHIKKIGFAKCAGTAREMAASCCSVFPVMATRAGGSARVRAMSDTTNAESLGTRPRLESLKLTLMRPNLSLKRSDAQWIDWGGTNSVAWVRERTIPTERPPLVGEVSAYFCGYRRVSWSAQRISQPYSRFSRPEPLLFLPTSSSVVLTRLSGPRSRPTTSQKIW
jgi:hypothetical protein